jgi:DNA primase
VRRKSRNPPFVQPQPAPAKQRKARKSKIGRVFSLVVVEDRMISGGFSSIVSLRRNGFDVANVRAIPIQPVAADLGFSLTARGTGRCRLPGHDDRNPSFAIRRLTNRFTCYACGGKGDVIDLVVAMVGLDFVGACNWLTDRYLGGAPLCPLGPSNANWSRSTRPVAVAPVEAAPAVAADHEVFGWILDRSPLGSMGDAYLRSRGFNEASIRHFRIGQISDRRRILSDVLGRFGRERLLHCGLTGNGQFGDRFAFPTGYILFPFMIEGEVAYLQARRPDQDTKWRWLCPQGLLPPVYNSDVLSDDSPTISICEGVTDVISAHEIGLPAIGLVGANGHLDAGTLARLRGRNVAVYGDGDEAGSRFSRRLVRLLADEGITAIPKRLPQGVNDLNDHLRRMRGLSE